MILHVTNAKYVGDYRVWLAFNNQTSGEIDLENVLWGTVFAPLKDKSVFRQFHLDPTLNTIVWPNGADLAPEFLHDQILKQAQAA